MLCALVEGIRREILILGSSDSFILKQGAESEFYKLFCGNSQPDTNVDPTEMFRNFRLDVNSDPSYVYLDITFTDSETIRFTKVG